MCSKCGGLLWIYRLERSWMESIWRICWNETVKSLWVLLPIVEWDEYTIVVVVLLATLVFAVSIVELSVRFVVILVVVVSVQVLLGLLMLVVV